MIKVTTAGTVLTASGVISGNGGLTKSGNGDLILSNAGNSFPGNIVVDGGTLTAPTLSSGFAGTLGTVNFAGRVIAVNAGATLNFAINNVFGNGVGNAGLPSIVLTGSTLISTRYNVIGSVILTRQSRNQKVGGVEWRHE